MPETETDYTGRPAAATTATRSGSRRVSPHINIFFTASTSSDAVPRGPSRSPPSSSARHARSILSPSPDVAVQDASSEPRSSESENTIAPSDPHERGVGDATVNDALASTTTTTTTITTISSSGTKPFVRPPILPTLKRHPRQTLYTLVLVFVFLGGIMGWALFLHFHRGHSSSSSSSSTGDDDASGAGTGATGSTASGTNGEGDDGHQVTIMADAGFLVLTLLAALLLLRQSYYMIHLFLPPRGVPSPSPSASDTSPNREGGHQSSSTALSFLPPWLLPRLPTYVDAVGGRNHTTGDVEDRWIVGEVLPLYGQTRGSKLLLRSESRGGAVLPPPPPPSSSSASSLLRESDGEAAGGRAERPVSYGHSQAQAQAQAEAQATASVNAVRQDQPSFRPGPTDEEDEDERALLRAREGARSAQLAERAARAEHAELADGGVKGRGRGRGDGRAGSLSEKNPYVPAVSKE